MMRRGAMMFCLAAALWAGAAATAGAIDPESFDDPALDARYRDLLGELRCMMCQNQTLSDSPAPLARDMRRLVRERLRAGDGDGEIKSRLVDRYGDFILYRPPLAARTWVLWFGPAALVAAALAALAIFWIRRGRRGEVDALDAAQKRRAAELLREEP